MACDSGKNKSASTKNLSLVCLGDSLTAGHGAVIPGVDDKSRSYPAFIQDKITIPVINAGVSGDTSAQGLARVNDVLSENPRIVIIELGANDLLQGVPITVTQNNLQEIIAGIKNEGRKIYIAKFYTETIAREMIHTLRITAGYNEQTELIKQYDEMFNSLAISNNAELIENIWTGVWGINMSDDIHPNENGYKIMAENYFKALKPYLEANNLLK